MNRRPFYDQLRRMHGRPQDQQLGLDYDGSMPGPADANDRSLKLHSKTEPRLSRRTRPKPLGPPDIRYHGVHCELGIHSLPHRVILLKISGTDIGEFATAPMKSLDDLIQSFGRIRLFIDARDVLGASIEVSGDWAAWLSASKDMLATVTMLTGSRFVQVTAEFVRRFASLEGVMRICTEWAVFDQALAEASDPQ